MFAPPRPADLIDIQPVTLANGQMLRAGDGIPLVASLYSSPWHPTGRRIIVNKAGVTVFDPGACFDFETALRQLEHWAGHVIDGTINL